MDLQANIDFKDLKRQKNSNRKQFKKAIKQKDYDMIQQCLKFVEKYDEMVKTDKHIKYYNSLPVDTKEIIRLREDLGTLKNLDLRVYETFEERLSNGVKEHINKYVERRLMAMKKELKGARKQVDTRITKRVKAAPKKVKLNIS